VSIAPPPDPRFALLFEPVRIGPVTAPNRFYQVPHCNGMGHRQPRALAAMRAVKAEGGWGVVCTEEVEIHPSSEISPSIEGRLWDDADVPAHRLMTDAVHEHGALAGIELVHNGLHAPNLASRLPPMAPSARPVDGLDPVQARAMDRDDIQALRRWHREAALRARDAGYDIVYAYAGHGMSTLMHFMQRRYNGRSDEYGGSVRNRVRLTREILTEMKEAVGDRCAVALRLAVDEGLDAHGIAAAEEGREIVAELADLPDLWDVNLSGWCRDSASARFEPEEGYQDAYTAFVKTLTGRPVVGVGRFTSPDGMMRRIRSGALDLIGAARPSIADPFLPRKIREGREDEIRECVGCNICVSGDNRCVPIRCTQNPTMGEEWRRGWHPERIPAVGDPRPVLVVGGGPAGMECSLTLARRGYPVTLVDAADALGGRLLGERALPGLASLDRVRGHRETLLRRAHNVAIYLHSRMNVEAVLEFGAPHVMLATGSRWRRDGLGRACPQGITPLSPHALLTPDDILRGTQPTGRVLLFDDDHYYMGGALAEQLRAQGCEVTLVTPAPLVSQWTEHTLEQPLIQGRLLRQGIELITGHVLAGVEGGVAELRCVFTDRRRHAALDSLVLVTAREPERALELALRRAMTDAAMQTLTAIGDCLAPGTVASAVYLGHLAARQLQGPPWEAGLYRRELPGPVVQCYPKTQIVL
jgi:dimethylamine/trimethylamine dehydrogenase